jgi:hypothetical protein
MSAEWRGCIGDTFEGNHASRRPATYRALPRSDNCVHRATPFPSSNRGAEKLFHSNIYQLGRGVTTFFSANFFDMLDQLFIRVLNIFKHHTLHSLPVDTPLPDLRMP